MSFECVLFDFDGTLADTEKYNLDYFALSVGAFGITLTDEDRKALLGNTDPRIIEGILSRASRPVSLEEWRKMRGSIGNTYESDERLHPEPGAAECLRELREKGLKLAVVSSTQSRLIKAALKRLSLYSLFDLILCGDDCQIHKPDPYPYLAAMERLGVTPEKSIVVEDSPSGIKSGKAAGALVIAYKGGCYEQDTSLADHEVESFPELSALIGSLLV